MVRVFFSASNFLPQRQRKAAAWKASLATASGILFLASPGYAQTTYTWTGASSNDWNNSGNWTGGLPVSSANTNLAFGTGSNTTSIDDFSGGFMMNTLTFISGSSFSYSVSGAALSFFLNGSAKPSITQSSSKNNSVANEIDWSAATLDLNGNGTGALTLSGLLNGTTTGGTVANLTKNGTSSITLTGVGSALTGITEVDGGTLLIASGGTVTNGSGTIGKGGTNSGTVTVTGDGSKWDNTGSGGSNRLYIGQTNGTGVLNISNGGTVIATTSYIGNGNSSTGTVNVDGVGSFSSSSSTWNTTTLYVGQTGEGTLNVTNGGLVSDSIGYVGYGSTSNSTAMGTVTVNGYSSSSGAVSTWTNSNSLEVGAYGTGAVNIQNGGAVSAANNYIGFNTGGGSIIVDGASTTGTASSLTSSSGLLVGYAGTGSLDIKNGGVASDAYGQIGVGTGSNSSATGTLTVEGTNSTTGIGSSWTSSGNVEDGVYGSGTLNILTGADVSDAIGYIGFAAGSVGMATVNGSGSTWTNSGGLYVANNGSGTLDIKAGGAVSDTTGYIGVGTAGNTGITGAVTVEGSGSSWTNSSTLEVGVYSTGTLNITTGGSVSDTTAYIGYNSGSSSTASVDGSGSSWTNSSGLTVGRNGTATLNITNSGAVSVTGATAIGTGSFISGNNGVLTTTTLTGTGTIQVAGSGLTINQSGASTYSGTIVDGSSSGVFTKAGSGTLTLAGSGSYTGGTVITGGELATSADSSLGSGAVTLNGGMLRWNGASETFGLTAALGSAGGGFDINSGTLTVGSNLSGSGALTKTGASALRLTGSSSYSGGTNISAGTLIANGSSLGMGAVSVSNGATLSVGEAVNNTVSPISTGSLTATSLVWIAGGTLTFNLGSSGVNDALTLTSGISFSGSGTFSAAFASETGLSLGAGNYTLITVDTTTAPTTTPTPKATGNLASTAGSMSWVPSGSTYQLVYHETGSGATPEPGSIALLILGMGLGGGAAAGRFRNRITARIAPRIA